MTIGLGIIGAGSIGTVHAGAAAKAGSRVAGVFDVDPARAETLAKQHGAAAAPSLAALLEDPALDAVVVACPNAFHRESAVAALEAGKDVLLEKPMALTVPECDEIIEAADRHGRLVQIGFVCRCAPVAVEVARLARDGVFGRIYHAKASLYRQRGIPGLGRWFTTRRLSGGGVLMDLGVHFLDLVMHVAGHPRPLRASAACTSTFGSPIEAYRFVEMWAGPPVPEGVFDVEDGATALVRFEGGLSLELNVTWAANVSEALCPEGVTLFGDEAGCVFHLWRNELTVTREQEGKVIDERRSLPDVDAWDAAWVEQHRRFARCVRERTPPEASAAQGRVVQGLLEAIYRSSREGREVEVEGERH